MTALLKVFDILPGWIWALLLAGALALGGVEHVRGNNARTELFKVRAEFAEAAAKAAEAVRKAEQAAREEEQRRERAKDEIEDAANQRIELANAAARDADAVAVSLRSRLAEFAARARQGAANPAASKAGEGKPSADPLDLLARVLTRADDEAGELAKYADALRVAGTTCEAAYDSLTQ